MICGSIQPIQGEAEPAVILSRVIYGVSFGPEFGLRKTPGVVYSGRSQVLFCHDDQSRRLDSVLITYAICIPARHCVGLHPHGCGQQSDVFQPFRGGGAARRSSFRRFLLNGITP